MNADGLVQGSEVYGGNDIRIIYIPGRESESWPGGFLEQSKEPWANYQEMKALRPLLTLLV